MVKLVMQLFMKGIFVFLVSTIFFYITKFPEWLYILIVDFFLFLSLYNYSGGINSEFYRNLVAALTGNIFAFGITYFMLVDDKDFKVYFQFDLVLLLFFVFGYMKCVANCHSVSKVAISNNKMLYNEHNYDLIRMERWIKKTNILGINSSWGNGKTFIVDHFSEKHQSEYHVIKIETLTYRYNEFDRVLIDKLDNLLREHRIFSFYSMAFKQTLGSNIWGRFIYHFFLGNQFSQTSIFTGLKSELEKLPKKVLIIFEDVERIGKEDELKRLFAIVERLSSNRIKFIYEYDAEQLKNGLSLKREYLEKYIPVEMNLTNITYQSLISAAWDELNSEDKTVLSKKICPGSMGIMNASKNLKEFLFSYVDRQYNPFSRQFKYGKINFQRCHLTTRRMKIFLQETSTYLQEYPGNEIDGQIARGIVAFVFLKNFAEDIYDKLEPWKSLENIFSFQYKGKSQTIEQLGQALWGKSAESHDEMLWKIQIEKQTERRENIESLLVYSIFGYCFDDLLLRVRYERKSDALKFQDALILEKAEERRENVNRLIWHLLENGRSEYTNKRACAEKFIKDVLNKHKDEWKITFASYCADLFEGKIYKDNQTIHTLGEIPLLSTVRALSYYYHGELLWGRICDFICERYSEKQITMEFIQLCYFVEIDTFQNAKKMIQLFNSCKICSNFNEYEPYMAFLRKYISKLTMWGFCNGTLIELLRTNDCDLKCIEKRADIIMHFEQEAKKLRQNRLLLSRSYLDDMEVLAAFIEKKY